MLLIRRLLDTFVVLSDCQFDAWNINKGEVEIKTHIIRNEAKMKNTGVLFTKKG